jgi:hypothetical protein
MATTWERHATNDYAVGSTWDGIVQPTTWHQFTIADCADITLEYCGTAPSFGDVWIVLLPSCPADGRLYPGDFQ